MRRVYLCMNMNKTPTILVIFGATGDLARRKIVPALWHLFREKKLPSDFSVIGLSRRDLDERAFRDHIAGALAHHRKRKPAKADGAFLRLFGFVRGYFDKEEAYDALKREIEKRERGVGTRANKLFYLAVAPELYETVLTNLARSGLSGAGAPAGRIPLEASPDIESGLPRQWRGSPLTGWTRIIVEKPFGKNADTAQALDELLGTLFAEEQIYRIDHYLAKEMIQNILAFRFSNNLFEKNWSRETIERIDIRLWEKIGVEERGGFYDGAGALRDVGQNHLLQMLALITMDRPESFDAPALRRGRADILRTLAASSEQEIARTSTRAQYDGYRTIRGVAPDSHTETYFKVNAALTYPRWRGVAITLESGKRLGEQKKEIVITFRHPTPCMCPVGIREHLRNKIVIALEPEERITIHFWSKKPGFAYDLEERTLTFLLRGEAAHSQYVEEYKKLLLDCITGDQTLFVSTEEVREMWQFTDGIMDAWQKNLVPLERYAPDTMPRCRNCQMLHSMIPGGQCPKSALPLNGAATSGAVREIGLIGLGKMGRNMAERLREKGWRVVAYDREPAVVKDAARRGAMGAAGISDLVRHLARPRLVWLMIPSYAKATEGKPAVSPVDEVLFGKDGLASILSKGDTVIDGGNSFYQDTIKRAKKLKARGIHFLDVGVSGGPEGARHGACLMIGGEDHVFKRHEDLFRDLALENGYAYVGGSGAGHFAKMIHNGIEYGMMQSLAEGFALLKKSKFGFELKKIAELYNTGSVIESRLVAWLAKAYEQHGEDLKNISGTVGHSGEAAWTVKTAKQLKTPTPVIEKSFAFRVQSKKNPSYIGKILSALRNQFGGHSVR